MRDKNPVDLSLVSAQESATIGGDLITMTRPITDQNTRVADVLEQCKRRINHAGTWTVGAASPLVDGTDDVVTVPRLLGQKGQDNVSEFPIVEEAPAFAALPAMPTMSSLQPVIRGHAGSQSSTFTDCHQGNGKRYRNRLPSASMRPTVGKGTCSGTTQCFRARDVLEQLTTRLCRQRRIDAEARAPIRLPTLQWMMHDVGDKHDLAFSAARDAHTEHSRRVSRRWTKGQAVAEIGVHLDQILTRPVSEDRRQLSVHLRPAGSSRWFTCGIPSAPFDARKDILGVGEGRHPAAVVEPGVPADVIDVQVRAQHVVDVLGGQASAARLQPGPVQHVEARRPGRSLWLPTQVSIRIVRPGIRSRKLW